MVHSPLFRPHHRVGLSLDPGLGSMSRLRGAHLPPRRWMKMFHRLSLFRFPVFLLLVSVSWLVLAAGAFPAGVPPVAAQETPTSLDWEFLYNLESLLSGIRLPDGTSLDVSTAPQEKSPDGSGRMTLSHKGQTLEAFQWDSVGRITALESDGQRVSISYDEAGRVASAAYGAVSDPKKSGAKPSQEIRYTWDNASRLAEIRSGQDYFTKYRYDILGRVSEVESPLGTIKYRYTSEKGLDVIVREMPKVVRSQWSFDPMNRPVEVVHADDRNSVIFKENREYNPDNSVRRSLQWTRETGPVHFTYDYDTLGRLLSVTRKPEKGSDPPQHYEFKYDPQGNLTERIMNGQRRDAFEYSPLGMLKTVNGAACQSDRLGFPREVQSSRGAMAFRYDAAGRLSSMTQDGRNLQFSRDVFGRVHTLDLAGRRLSVIHDVLAPSLRPLITSGPDTEHYWSGSAPIGFRDKAASRLYLTDLSGTVRALADPTGRVTDYIEYAPDGQLLKGPKGLSALLIATGSGRLLDTVSARDIPSAALQSPGIAASLMDLNLRLAQVRAEKPVTQEAKSPRDQAMALPEPTPNPFARELGASLVDQYKWDMVSWTAQKVADNPSFSPRIQGIAQKMDLAATWIPLLQSVHEVRQRYLTSQASDPYTHAKTAEVALSLVEAVAGSSLAGGVGAVIGQYAELGSAFRSTVLHERAKDLIRLPSELSSRIREVSQSVDRDSGRYELWGDRMYAASTWKITHDRFQPARYEAAARYGWQRNMTDGARFVKEKVDATATEMRTGRGGLLGSFMDDESWRRERRTTSHTHESFSGDAFNRAWAHYEQTGKWEPMKFAPPDFASDPGKAVPLPPAPKIPEPKYRASDTRLKKPEPIPKPFDPFDGKSPSPSTTGEDGRRKGGLILVSDRGINQYNKAYSEYRYMLDSHLVFELPSARKNNPTYQQSQAVVEQRAYAAAMDYFKRHPGARNLEIRLTQDVNFLTYALGGEAQDRAGRYTAAFYRGLNRAAQEMNMEIGTLAGSNAGRTHSYAIQTLAAEGKKATSFIVYNDAQVKKEVVEKVIPLLGAGNVTFLCERSGFHGSLEKWGVPSFIYSRGDLAANPRVASDLARRFGTPLFLVNPPGADVPVLSHTVSFDHSRESIVDRQYNPKSDRWDSMSRATPASLTLGLSSSLGAATSDVSRLAQGSISPANVGGVWLRGASKHLEGLGQIKGVARDENGRMLLLTGTDEKAVLPPMRLDDVVTIFRSVYEEGEAPFVSIDPVPENPRGPVMDIRHGKATAATYPGWILFETDRVMKALGLGYDNLTREKVSCAVQGYKNQFHEDFLTGGAQSEVWERFWIVPASANRRTWEKAGTRLALLDIPLEVKTQRMRMVKGKLEPADDPTPTPGAAYFSKWFTNRYDDIAREWLAKTPGGNGMDQPIKIYEELRRIALITAIAEYMREQGEPMPGWVREYTVQPFSMPQQTPSLLVEEKHQRGNTIITQQVYGGVDLTPETSKVTTVDGDKEAKHMGEKLAQTFDRDPPPLFKPVTVELPSSTAGQKVEKVAALALPGSRTKAPGSLQIAQDDLVVMAGGQYPLRLPRRLSSFTLPSGEFGRGWTMGLPRLEASKQVISKEGDHVTSRTVYNLSSPLGDVNAVFARERTIEGRGTYLVDDQFQEALGLGSAEDKRLGGKVHVVEFHDGRQWLFRDDGALVAETQGPFLTYYGRDGNGRIQQIAGFIGETCVADIRLDYDDHGRILVARASDGKGARYTYEAGGELRSVEIGEGLSEDLKQAHVQFAPKRRLDYAYQNGLPTSVALNGTTVQHLEYDELGRVKKRIIAGERDSGQTVEYRNLSGGRTEMVDPASGTLTRYDPKMRPVIQVKRDGTLWKRDYAENGTVSVQMHTPGGEMISLKEDAAGKGFSATSSWGETVEISKDPGTGVVALKRNGQELEHARAATDGIPVEYVDLNQRVQFEYDNGGRLKRMVNTSPSQKVNEVRGDWMQTEVDQWNRPTSIQTGYGDKLQLVFDDLDQPVQIVDNGRALEIKRNPDGSAVQVKTNWGEGASFSYDGSNGLTQYTMTRDGGNFAVTMTAPSTPQETGERSIDVTDYRNHRTRLEINDREQFLRILHPDQTETRIQVDKSRDEVLVEDGAAQTRSLYDGNGNLVKISQKVLSQ